MQNKWNIIYDTLKNEIMEMKENEKLPSERILCERFSVNRITVRKAVDKLILDNFLVKFEKKGTFVTKYKPYKIHSDLDLVNFQKVTTDFKFVQHPILNNVLHFTSRQLDENNKLQSVEEVFISRQYLPAKWDKKYENIIQEDLVKFIEIGEYAVIRKIDKTFTTFETNGKYFVLLKSDIISNNGQTIAISTSIFPVKDFKFSFSQYR